MDIDIDMADRNQILSLIQHVPASIVKDGDLIKHVCGVYVQTAPIDPVTNLSALPYDVADQLGLFKIDFLNVNLYNEVRDNAHLEYLIEKEPLWDLLLYSEIVEEQQLFHLSEHLALLQQMKPKSVIQLAMTLGLRLPAKRYLIGKSWDIIEQHIWVKPKNGDYYFKKSHAISYAVAVCVHLNLIEEKLTQKLSE